MKLIIGLGNPGGKYRNTRHNVGFNVLDKLAKIWGLAWEVDKKTSSITALHQVNKTRNVLLAKPQTFMNASGKAVKSLCTKHNIQGADLVIVHDDLDIKLGDYKIQFGKGPKVHNGLLSIKKFLGTQNFWHVRVGIDNRSADNRLSGEAYVLQSFSSSEKVVMDKVVKEVASELTNKLYKGY